MRSALASLLVALCVAAPAHATKLDAEARLIQTMYDGYVAAQKDGDAELADSLTIIEKHGTKELKRALRLERRCSMKTQGICAIDADIAINAQDWEISGIKIGSAAPTNDTQKIVRAEFRNLDRPTRVDYYFVREGDAWKINEVEAVTLNADSAPEEETRWRLKEHILKTLKQFNESRLSFLHST